MMTLDAQRQELEAEFFAQYDVERSKFSALDPETEAVADNYLPKYPETPVTEVRLMVLTNYETHVCPACEAVPF